MISVCLLKDVELISILEVLTTSVVYSVARSSKERWPTVSSLTHLELTEQIREEPYLHMCQQRHPLCEQLVAVWTFKHMNLLLR